MFPKQVFGLVGMAVPGLIEKVGDKKFVVVMMVFLFSSQISNYFTITGGFRIIIDGQIIYDVLG